MFELDLAPHRIYFLGVNIGLTLLDRLIEGSPDFDPDDLDLLESLLDLPDAPSPGAGRITPRGAQDAPASLQQRRLWFLQQLKQQKPQLQSQQVQGRALLWDKQVDREVWDQYRAARVAQNPYVYQTQS